MPARRFLGAFVLILLGAVLSAAPVQADSITFVFTCQIVTSLTPDSCIEGGSGPGDAGPFGTLTITDHDSDDLVDIEWTMTPQWGTNIERILLNFNQPFLSGYQLNLDPGVNTNIIGSNGQPSGTTWQFDIRVNEPSPQGLTFTGTLSYCHNVTLDCFDLEPTHFNALSNNLSGATPQLYALFRTAQPGTVTPGWTTSNGTEFWAGASQAPTLVPGPAPLLLLSTGLLGLSGWKAWRRIRGEGRTER